MSLFTKGIMIAGFGTKTWLKIIMGLDSIIFSFIGWVYQLFLILSRATIIDDSVATQLVRRIYSIIGVVALFMLTYGMLRKMVNPDAKDKESLGKTVINIVKAIILLAIVPSLFTYAFRIQTAVLNKNTIGKIILGADGSHSNGVTNPNELIEKGGVSLSHGIFDAFIFPAKGHEADAVVNGMPLEGENGVKKQAEDDESFTLFMHKDMIEAIDNDTVTYYWGVSTAAGIFVIYILISYCLSLGFRVVKLAFYEVMAPVCIIASILPSQKEMLNRWIKATLQTFAEVFIRVAVLYFMVYVINLVAISVGNGTLFGDVEGGLLKGLAQAMVFMGVVTFMKSAPDLISKLTGLDSGSMSLGIKDQLAKGGFFTAGALAGGAATSMLRNGIGAFSKTRNAFKDAKSKTSGAEKSKAYAKAVGSIFTGAGSTLAGGASGGFHAFNKDAKSFSDMKAAASKGAKTAGENKAYRASYKAQHGGTWGAIKGHIKDTGESALDFAGIGSVADLEDENKALSEVKSKIKAVKTGAADVINGEVAKSSSGFAISTVKTYNKAEYDALQDAYLNATTAEEQAKALKDFKAYENAIAFSKMAATPGMTLAQARQAILADAATTDYGKISFSATGLKNIKQGLATSKVAGPLKGESKDAFEARINDTENFVGDVEYQFGQAVQNAAYSSESDFAKLDTGIQAAMSGVRIAASDARETVNSSLHLDSVKEAGFDINNVKGAWDVTDKKQAISKVGDIIDIKVAQNTQKINEHQKKKAQREEGKKDKS